MAEFPHIRSKHSLVAKHVTKEKWDRLSSKVTKTSEFTLAKAIACAVEFDNQHCGIYAGDWDSYKDFAEVFDPIIQEYHGIKSDAKHTSDMDSNKIRGNVDDVAPVKSTRIRVGRNLDGFGLSPGILKHHRVEFEQLVKKAFTKLTGDLAGTYYPLNGMSEKDRQQLVDDHFLFMSGDRNLQVAGMERDWPEGRGIFHNKDKTFLVWVNEEDQLRIISMQEGKDVKGVFERLARGIKAVEDCIKAECGKSFMLDEKYGYIHSCPTNLGTGMRASVHVTLPGWHRAGLNKLKQRCEELAVQPRGTRGESGGHIDDTYDISNKHRLGYSEVELVQTLIDSVNTLVQEDRELQKEFPNIRSKHSLVAKHVTKEKWDRLSSKVTKTSEFTLGKAIACAVEFDNQHCGIYAGDWDSYKDFAEVFDPIIQEYHGINAYAKHTSDMDFNKIKENVNRSALVNSTRIRVGRNLDGFGLSPGILKHHRVEFEQLVKKAFTNLTGDLAGTYYPLNGMSEKDRQQLVDDHFLFMSGDRNLQVAGMERDWPEGRGIFHNKEKTFLVWVNEEDQLRIISMQEGKDVKAVFERLTRGIKAVEDCIKAECGKSFMYDEKYGYIHSCPTNLGTGMRASVHVTLPGWHRAGLDKLKQRCEELAVQPRGTRGESGGHIDDTYDISNKHRLGYSEVELVKTLISAVNTLYEEDRELQKEFPGIRSKHSLVAKHVTKDRWDRLHGIVTKTSEFTLAKAIACAVEFDNQHCGIYAGDWDSYKEFAEVFDPIIQEYHGIKSDAKHTSDMDSNKIKGNVDSVAPVKSTRIRVGRNLDGFGLSPGILKHHRVEFEQLVKKAFTKLTGDLAGTYYPLNGMSEKDRQQLVDDHFLFMSGDRNLQVAGMERDWPEGRGIFHNKDKTFLVWVNEEDQLRIISMQEGKDVKGVFERLARGIKAVEDCIKAECGKSFMLDEKYGYIHSCPTNLGTGMRASVHVTLPGWHRAGLDRLKRRCEELAVQPRGTRGESGGHIDDTYDISNKHRLGYSEVELVQTLINSVNTLVQEDLELQKEFPNIRSKHSLVARHVTKEKWNKLHSIVTKTSKFTLAKAIACAVEFDNQNCGIYAGDWDSYKDFAEVFDPIIQEYHGIKSDAKHTSDMDSNKIRGNVDDVAPVKSTRIRVGRNLDGFGLSPGILKHHRVEFEQLVKKAFTKLSGDLAGTYYPLNGMSERDRQQLVDDHFLFMSGDRNLQVAGMERDWPEGRGIFHNKDKTFLVWVNEEDQLRIISMQEGKDVKGVFERLARGIKAVEDCIKAECGKSFMLDEKYGYIHSCPTNLGTGMRASVHVTLPGWHRAGLDRLKQRCEELAVQPRGTRGESGGHIDDTYDISNKHRLGYSEVELVQTLINSVNTLVQEDLQLQKEFPNIRSKHSLVAKHVTKDKWDRLQGIVTKTSEFTLAKAIACAVDFDNQHCGIYAGDWDSYKDFAEVFDPIIQEYHGIKPDARHTSDMDSNKIRGNVDSVAPVKSTRIRVGRNLDGFGLSPGILKHHRVEFEQLVRKAFRNLKGDLAGTYYPLSGMSERDRQQLVDDHFLFMSGDRNLQVAGMERDWPEGRGIFHNKDKTFLVWVNEEDQLRIISMEEGKDVKGVFERLARGIKAVEDCIKAECGKSFMLDEKYGYIHSCPTNLGTGMRASVHVTLPGWHKAGLDKLKQRCEELAVQPRGTRGESGGHIDDTYDISNKHRLGYSEVELVQTLINSVNTLVKEDLELQRQFPNIRSKHSLVAKHVTKDKWDKLQGIVTKTSKFTLAKAIACAVDFDNQNCGIYAGDWDSYKDFAEVFDPIIQEYHGIKADAKHTSDMDSNKIRGNVDTVAPVKSTRIRVGRNLDGFGLSPGILKHHRVEFEQLVKKAFRNLKGDLAGTYYPLSGMSERDRKQLVDDHFLFMSGDRNLQVAGMERDWPEGRGIFHNKEKTFLVWVNEEDQLRIISMEEGKDVKRVFERLGRGIKAVEDCIREECGRSFMFDQKYGYIHSCPTNLGTGMRASVHVTLPGWHRAGLDKLKQRCEELAVQPRGTRGESGGHIDDTYDISNKHRLGYTEVELIQILINAVNKLVKEDREMQKQFPDIRSKHSLVAKHVTKDRWDRLQGIVTNTSQFTLAKAIACAVEFDNQHCGIYAGDWDSYKDFAEVFDPIIQEYHGIKPDARHTSDMDSNKIKGNVEKSAPVKSTRIRVGRNLDGFGLSPGILKHHRVEFEQLVKKAFRNLKGDLAGTYYPLNGMSERDRQQLVDDHFLFMSGDRNLQVAGMERDWPEGRGIFHNKEKTFLVWVNEEDQLRIISMQEGKDVKGVFERLARGIQAVEDCIKAECGKSFMLDEKYGYIHSCPTNLGTGMRASVHVTLPGWHRAGLDRLKQRCEELAVQPRGTRGESGGHIDDTYDISNKHRLGYSEVELVQTLINSVNTLVEEDRALQKQFPNIRSKHSLVAKHVTKDKWERLQGIVTKTSEFTLAKAIACAVEFDNQHCGIYAGDWDSYKDFAEVFDPIIQEYHGIKANAKHTSDMDSNKIKGNVENSAPVKSTRIRVGRNLDGFGLSPGILKHHRVEFEQLVKKAFGNLKGDLAGTYYPLNGMSERDRQQLVDDHFLFMSGDRNLQVAGMERDWPEGRGIFHNKDKTFLVWVNEEDQLRIISMQEGKDVKGVFERLARGIKAVEDCIKAECGKSFMLDEKYGYIHSCPTNLGTGMRASVHVTLPGWHRAGLDKLKQRCEELAVQPRGTRGESGGHIDDTYDISNKHRLGYSEVELVQTLINSVNTLVEEDRVLQKQFPNIRSKHSLVAKHVTKDKWDRLQGIVTKTSEFTLAKAIACAVEFDNQNCGIYAGDWDSYRDFAEVFDPIIQEYHGINAYAVHTSDMDSNKIRGNVDDVAPVKSTRIRVGRNLDGFGLSPGILKHHRVEFEQLVKKAFTKLTGDLAGTYYPLNGMSEKDRQQLVDDHFLFMSGDRNLQVAGMERDWPEGRGIFHNKDKTFLVWVNEEDQLRIISMQEGKDVKGVFERLARGINAVEDCIKAECGKSFMLDEKYGYIHSCPTNLGTGMRASVHVTLPGWHRAGLDKLKQRCEELAVQPRGTRGESGGHIDDTYDISNKHRLGYSEVELVQTLIDSVNTLVKEDRELQKQFPNIRSKHSLVAKHVTKDKWDRLQGIVTKTSEFTLAKAIACAVEFDNQNCGIYAGDWDSYKDFAEVFDPIIQEYHGIKADAKHTSDMDSNKIKGNVNSVAPVKSTRIRVGRNLDGFGLSPGILKHHRVEFEQLVKKAFRNLKGDLAGTYYPLNGMSERDRQQLVDDHFLFMSGDRNLQVAGMERDWPEGRGIFHNKDKTFLVWVNEEDQLRIISMQEGKDVKGVFERLARGIKAVEDCIKSECGKSFMLDEKYGYIHSCPTNLGTGMRASVHVTLPGWHRAGLDRLKQRCEELAVQPRGTRGESGGHIDDTYDISNKHRLGYSEVELVQTLINSVNTLVEEDRELQRQFPHIRSKHSLVAKHVTKDKWERLSGIVTKTSEFTLAKAIACAVDFDNQHCGIYAGDWDSYKDFAEIFDPIIQEYHGIKPDAKHTSDMDSNKIKGNVDSVAPVKSTRIRVGRNLDGFGLSPGILKHHRVEFEQLVKKAFRNLKGDLAGTYYPLNGMSERDRQQLVDDHFLFMSGDRNLQVAGMERDWPEGRGIFHNKDKTFLVWVNEEDQLRIISMQEGKDVKGVFERLARGIKAVEDCIKAECGKSFMLDEKYGYIHSCPTNLGTGMRASVHVTLPGWHRAGLDRLKQRCEELAVQPRGTRGESGGHIDDTYDISNKHRLGYSEVELVQTLINSVNTLVEEDRELQKEFPNIRSKHSLVAKHVTKDKWDKLQGIVTKTSEFTLAKAIACAVEFDNQNCGIYAGDWDSYKDFAEVFDPIIQEYHGIKPDAKHHSDMDSNKIKGNVDSVAPVKSTRIRVGRNLDGFGLSPGILKHHRVEFEQLVKKAFRNLKGDLAGTYYPLNGMSERDRQQLVDDHFLFMSGDRNLQVAGMERDWPEGRGIFHNKDKTFLVWVNEEDQLRIISMQEGKDVKGVFERLARGIKAVEDCIKEECGKSFMLDEKYGYIHSCPTNLGTGMRASVHVTLPGWHRAGLDRLKQRCEELAVQPRGTRGESGGHIDDTYDISNKHRLGYSEVELVQTLINSVNTLVREDLDLQKQFPNIRSKHSLVAKHVTKDKWDRLQGIVTKTSEFTLAKAIACAVQFDNQHCGIYAGDWDSYKDFAEVFDPIIQEYHGIKADAKHTSDMDSKKIRGNVDDVAPVKSTRIRVGRNLDGFGLSPGILKHHRVEFEQLVKKAFTKLTGDLAGTYYPLNGMSERDRQQLVDDHFLFMSGDRNLQVAGMERDWPEGRGIFHNKDKTFLVWVNEEDQLRIISMQEGKDVKGVFERLARGIKAVEDCIRAECGRSFMLDEKYGYIHSCPTNLGTGMRASVHVTLPGWHRAGLDRLKQRCEELAVQPRGTRGESGGHIDDTYDISNKHRLGYSEVELVQTLINSVNTLVQEDRELQREFPDIRSRHSLVAKHVTKDKWDRLSSIVTKTSEFTLAKAIACAVEFDNQHCGIYAGDWDSYKDFAEVFDPIIQEYHGIKADAKHTSDMDSNKIRGNVDSVAPVKSTRIRVGRNLDGFGLSPGILKHHRVEFEQLVKKAFRNLKGDLAGTYYPLNGMSERDRQQLVDDHFLFMSGDRNLQVAGMERDWPEGRGIFHNKDKTFLVWVNEEDQLRIISMQEGKDVKGVFERLARGIKAVEDCIKAECGRSFMLDEKYGYIHSCPTNLGTGMRASVHVTLPGWHRFGLDRLKQRCEELAVQPRGTRGESGGHIDDTYDISNKHRLGYSEVELVQTLINSVNTLVKEDLDLQKQFPNIRSKHSLVAKHVTKDKWDRLQGIVTKTSEFTLSKAIACAVEFDNQHCGIYAGDWDSYKDFAEVFDPIIQEYHGIKADAKHTSDMDSNKIRGNVDSVAPVKSTRIRVGRNLDGFGLSPGILKHHRVEFEQLVKKAFRNLKGDLAGTYYPLNGMSERDRQQLVDDHFLFMSGDRNLQVAGMERDWPEGRGIFHNKDKTFLVWVNEEDQLRIISMQEGKDVKGVFERLARGIKAVEDCIKAECGKSFMLDEKYGYIHSCPTNLGTGMRASVHVTLPGWHRAGLDKLKQRCEELAVQPRGTRGESGGHIDDTYDISNKHRLGYSEVELVQTLIDSVNTLVQEDLELQKEFPNIRSKDSLVAKYVTKQKWDKLQGKKTKTSEFTLAKAIACAVEFDNQHCGIYAGDWDSYKGFACVFDPIIQEYHGIKPDAKHTSDMDASKINGNVNAVAPVKSTRIRVGRNLEGFGLSPGIMRHHRLEFEQLVRKAFTKLSGDLAGTYYPLSGMSERDRQQLVDDHFLFMSGDRNLQVAGMERDWPEGRGIFHNKDKTFLVWVNEEDQLRIISMQEGKDVKGVFERLARGIKAVEDCIRAECGRSFMLDEKYGYIHSCPTNLGTGMRASVHVTLPGWHRAGLDRLKQRCEELAVQPRGTRGESGGHIDDTYDISNKHRLGYSEVELVQTLINSVNTLVEEDIELQKQFPNIRSEHSLVAKHVTKDKWERLQGIVTKTSEFTLSKAIACAVEFDNQHCGIYAGDWDSYKDFAEVFDPIIQEYHGIKPDARHTSDMDSNKIKGNVENSAPVKSTRIRVGRNLDGFGLSPGILKHHRVEFEQLVKKAFRNLKGDLAGTYYPLSGMSERDRQQLVDDHFLFMSGDRNLQVAGMERDWPEGRGIFHNKDKTFLVWVNEEDQLRIISMQEGKDVKGVFERLARGIKAVEDCIKAECGKSFMLDEKYGYIHSCPTNLGTGMRASVHVTLPGWHAAGLDRLKQRCEELAVQPRGTRGESGGHIDDTYDISNKHRLGYSEVQLVQTLIDSVNTLVQEDRELQKEFPNIRSTHSLVAKHVTKDKWDKLQGIVTKTSEFTLGKAIACAVQFDNQHCGIYAGDWDSYKDFAEVFDPIIQEYHGIKPDAKHTSDMDSNKIKGNVDDVAPVKSTRIRVGRNLDGFGLSPGILKHHRVEFEQLVRKAFTKLTGDLAGTYYPLNGMSERDRQQLVDDHFLFMSGDRNLQVAGMERDWPEGRGIFHNKDKTFLVWVNEEDQLRIISMQEGKDVKGVFERLARGIKAVEDCIKVECGKSFMLDEKYGYIHSCPTNLGTGMRASVHVTLPGWHRAGIDRLKQRCEELAVQPRGTRGESGGHIDDTYDISNKHRLGYSEVELVQTLIDSVNTLVKEDLELQKQSGSPTTNGRSQVVVKLANRFK